MNNSETTSAPPDLLAGLNPSQRDAVTAPDGPLLVLAGAGSGKTRAIAHRIAYIIHQRRIPPWTVLALTFTNKAAAEMRSRVAALVGRDAPDLWILTFHALGLRLLRRFGTDIGLPAGFVVYDEDDRRSLLRRVVRELGLTERSFPVWRLASAVSARKNAAFSSPSYTQWQAGRDQEVLERIAQSYQSLLESSGGVDFDDLLLRCIELMECSESARQFAERRFQHVLVDEYQDTNRIQYRLLRLLAPHHNLFVVGDEDQSIYNFRGADLRNILDFERDFPATRIVKLEHNYRSTGAILQAAGALIACNQDRSGKRLIPCLEAGDRPTIYGARNEQDEAAYVALRVESLLKEFDSIGIAVLYRTNAQSRLFEEEFIKRRIPHILVGGQRFYERREIKDALAYLRLVINPRDDPSFERVVNVPTRGVGEATLALLRAMAAQAGLSLWDTASRALGEKSLSTRAHAGLSSFCRLVDSLSAESTVLSPAKLAEKTIKSSELVRTFEKESPIQHQTRLENLSQLLSAVSEYEAQQPEPSLAAFLDNVSLLTDLDTVRSDTPCLLMTLHSAKGLEFDAVFLTGLEEGLFPHTLSLGNRHTVEEERRLCYVGMTRAKSRLTLTHALSRRTALQADDREPSRFLDEIPPQSLVRDPSSASPDSNRSTQSYRNLRPGTIVRHPLFGKGTVEEVDSSQRDDKITVAFRSAGKKRLLARYANLEILGKPKRPPYRW